MIFSQNSWSNAGFRPLNLRHTSTFGRRLRWSAFPRSYGRKLQHIRYFLPKNAFFSKKICVCAIFVVPLHPLSEKDAYFGTLPERLGIGLQNRGRRFESARYLLEKSRSVEWLFLLDALQADGRLRLLDIGRPLG